MLTKNEFQEMCAYNNKNYVSSDQDYIRYAEQFVEKDSRNFRHNAANALIDKLNAKWGH